MSVAETVYGNTAQKIQVGFAFSVVEVCPFSLCKNQGIGVISMH